MELGGSDVHDDALSLGARLDLDAFADIDPVFARVDGSVGIGVGVDAFRDSDVLVVVIHVAAAGLVGDRSLVGDAPAPTGDGGAGFPAHFEEITILGGSETDDGALFQLRGGLHLDLVDVDAIGGALILDVPFSTLFLENAVEA